MRNSTQSRYTASNGGYKANHGDNDGGVSSAVIAGAAGFGLGLLAAAGRKAAVQAATFATGDWCEGLKAEHVAARTLLEKLADTTDEDHAKRAPMVLSLQHAIGKHNVQEEYVVYAVLASTGQLSAASELNAEHFELKTALYELEQIGKEQRPGFLEKLGEIRTAFEDHVREEEDVVFPMLQASLSAEENKALTGRMNREGFKVA